MHTLGAAVLDITQMLEIAGNGDGHALSELYARVYAELRQIAGACMRGERAGHTLQPTALVAEAYLRLTNGRHLSFENKAHFFSSAGRVMRQILVQYARQKRTLKRGGLQAGLDPSDSIGIAMEDPARMIYIDEALGRLALIDPRAVQVVELRFFAGLTVEEAAETLGVSTKTIKRDWQSARVWLERELRSVAP